LVEQKRQGGCEEIAGDVNRDCIVYFKDFAAVAKTWQQEQFWPW